MSAYPGLDNLSDRVAANSDRLRDLHARLEEVTARLAEAGNDAMALQLRVMALEQSQKPAEPQPGPEPRTPSIDLSRIPPEVTPGELLDAPVTGIGEGTPVWVHWFGEGWNDSVLVRESSVVEAGEIDLAVPEIEGVRVLQLQIGGTDIKAHTIVTVEPAVEQGVPAIPADPQPKPDPASPLPLAPAPEKYPALPKPTSGEIIELEPGVTDLSKHTNTTPGVVNVFRGPRDARVYFGSSIGKSIVALDGVSLAKPIYGNSGGQAWLHDTLVEGKPGAFSGQKHPWPAPTWGLSKSVFIKSRIQHCLRGTRNYSEVYGCVMADLIEDVTQNATLMRDTVIIRPGWPHFRTSPTGGAAHSDIFQCMGRMDIHNVVVIGPYRGQCFALASAVCNGSKFSYINISGVDPDMPIGMGAMIETKVGDGGPSNITFDHINCDKAWYLRTDPNHKDRWRGQDIRVTHSNFGGQVFEDETFGGAA